MRGISTILQAAGFPPDVLVLDFETHLRKGYDLRRLSTVEYITDPRFEVLGLAAADRHHVWWLSGPRVWGFLNGYVWDQVTVVCQNARLDCGILAWRYGIVPPFVVDVRDLSRHLDARARHRLADMAKRWKLPAKGEASFDWTRRLPVPEGARALTPQAEAELAAYARHDADLERELFVRMLPLLTRPEAELPLARDTLHLYLRPTLRVDPEQARSLRARLAVETALACRRAGITAKVARSTGPFRLALEEALGDEPVPLKAGKAGPVMALAKADPEREELLAHPEPRVRRLVEARIAAKSLSLHRSRVEGMLAQSQALGGVLPVALNYYGAHTGRWSGAEDINLHNLGKRAKGLMREPRRLLLPPPGHLLVCADFAAIEARVLAWLAGQDDLVQVFAEGGDPYCRFASTVLGRPVTPDDRADRQLGKVGVLGCGYGMGPAKARLYALGYGVELDEEAADRLVRTYRRQNERIVRYWGELERAFRRAVRHREAERAGAVEVQPMEGGARAVLPSGRVLHYHRLAVRMEPRGRGQADSVLLWRDATGARKSTRLWGGFLTENVVQAISRDILADTLLELRRQGIPACLHVHDEVVVAVPEAEAEARCREVVELCSTTPPWAPGLPLAAEGQVKESYGG